MYYYYYYFLGTSIEKEKRTKHYKEARKTANSSSPTLEVLPHLVILRIPLEKPKQPVHEHFDLLLEYIREHQKRLSKTSSLISLTKGLSDKQPNILNQRGDLPLELLFCILAPFNYFEGIPFESSI